LAEDDVSEADERVLNRAAEVFFLMLLVVGVVLYVGYALYSGYWFDIGIYAVAVPFVLFGIGGLALNHLKRKQEGKFTAD
jgi:uncharacterized membrane protein YphA (DoxX/SURF4 family)